MYPYLIQGNNVVIVVDNKSYTINKTHLAYQKLVDAIKASDWASIKDLVDPKQVVLNYGTGNVTIDGEVLKWQGTVMDNSLATRMIQMLKEGFPIEPMVNFMENLMSNPSYRAVTELYGFLEKCNLPITPDGHFLAYKKVRANYLDVHSGTMDNSVGKVVSMPRNLVNDDKDKTCSAGLHFCSQSYLTSFGGDKTVILKINPRDVVSIPTDYNDAKGRACRYEVIGELAVAPNDAFVAPVQTTAVGSVQVSQPKTGSSDFYKGYQTGYSGVFITNANTKAFTEGLVKGQTDTNNGVGARYKFVAASTGPWPWPVR